MKNSFFKYSLLIAASFALICCNNSSKDKKDAGADTATKAPTPSPQDTAVQQPSVPTTENQPTEFQYGPAVSTITGTIYSETFFGPPGYGENPKTDKKELKYLVETDRPITVIGNASGPDDDGEETKKGVTKIQLIWPDNVDMEALKGKKVKLTGTFFGPNTGHHHTDVLMDVTKIE